jgi:HD-GYP domain-containing protein (c-di-GMP phosphodiesterase class II)
MLRVSVHRIQPGMVLARPVPYPHDPHRYLLQRDREIPMDLVPRLQQLGIVEVWVRCRDLEFLEAVIDEEVVEQQRGLYSQVRKNFEQVMHSAAAQIDFSEFAGAINDLFDCLKRSQFGNVLLQKLDAFDCYLMSHSTNVCYLSLLLGMKLERYLISERSTKTPKDAKDLRELGLGCLLHDVGKMLVDPEVLNKPGRLSAEEFDAIKRHPELGYHMVEGKIPPAAAQIVLNHHQRYNGQGYPRRVDRATGNQLDPLAGKRIPVFSRIATLCDVYDAATTARVYSPAKLPIRALYEMRTYCRGFFDPVVEQAFYEIIPPFPIGQTVTLSNGMDAVVVDFNNRFPVRPKVQAIRSARGEPLGDPAMHEIDLAIHTDLEVVAIEGEDVRTYVEAHQEQEAALS